MSEAVIMELTCLGRIILAGVCGGVIGYERQSKRKMAGIRTHVIVAISSALMVVLSKYGFRDVASEYIRVDPSRIAAAVVTAIGFLGSGMIIFRNNNVRGLTTSAGIWATVGVGMAVGAGMYIAGIAVTLMVLLVELFLGRKAILARRKKKMGQGIKRLTIEYLKDLGALGGKERKTEYSESTENGTDIENREGTEKKYTGNVEHTDQLLAEIRQEILAGGGKITAITVGKAEEGVLRVCVQAKAGEGWDAASFAEKIALRHAVLEVTLF